MRRLRFGFGGERSSLGLRPDPRNAPHRPTAALPQREHEVRLVVEAVEALDDGLLGLLDRLGSLAGLGVDLEDALVVDPDLEVLRPAAVTAQPGGCAYQGSSTFRRST